MYQQFETVASRALNSIPLLYLVFFLTGWATFVDLVYESWYYPQMMHETGNLSVSYLIITLLVTPVLALISKYQRGLGFGRWLMRRRKHFGIACFIYAAVHTLHYIRYIGDATLIWLEALDFEYLVGWLGLIIFAVLAATSNRASTKWLGRRWKPLHRFVYLATVMTWLHWWLFEFFTEEVIFWGVFLLVGRTAQLAMIRLAGAVKVAAKPLP